MENLWTLAFWKRVVENDVHVFAGGMLGIVAGKTVGVGGLTTLPWHAALDAGLMAVVVSTLMSLASQTVPNTPPAGFLPPAVEEVKKK